MKSISLSALIFYAEAKLTPSSLQVQMQRASTATNEVQDMAVSQRPQHPSPILQMNPVRARGSTTGMPSHSDRIQGSERPAPRASQTGFPSTIPDSSRTKMHPESTPSDGDTQPVSQWVYDEKSKEISKELGSGKSGPLFVPEQETGQIDLGIGDFEQEAGEGEDDPMLIEDLEDDQVDLLSQDVNVRAEIFPETLRFQQPKTPLAQGTKRKRASQQDTPQMETPRLPLNPFTNLGSASDMMRPSQIFKATQAQTSPRVLLSDGLYERPSPNLKYSRAAGDCGLSIVTGDGAIKYAVRGHSTTSHLRIDERVTRSKRKATSKHAKRARRILR